MEASAQAIEARVEGSHWWFAGRRSLVSGIIESLGIRPDARVLDVGSGTGTNLRMLAAAGFERVFGLDCSRESVRFCRDKHLGRVELGDAGALPFADASFDLVLATDVIEHLDDDAAALAGLRRVLRPGGSLIVTVPAFQSLWGIQDEVSHHRRRYRRAPLLEALSDAGLTVEDSFYFNYLLFAPIWLARRLIRWLRVPLESENSINTPLLNRLLGALFALDVRSAPRVRPGFGVSILAVARRD